MSNKYTIRNCELICNGECPNSKTGYCQDCTDCVLKQIVERCKKVRECTADICTNPYEYATYCETRGVLQLLDIEECE